MLKRILPAEVSAVIGARLNEERVYELRFRAGMPVMVNYGGSYYYLNKNGIADKPEDAFVLEGQAVQSLVVRATEYSLYSVNNQLAKGFITITGGVRIGICGELVEDAGCVKTIKNFSSVNIRIPHQVPGCAKPAWNPLFDDGVKNTLLVGPPGAGKTTVLRDIVCNLSREGTPRNILVVDERCELAAVHNTRPQLLIGRTADIISNCGKAYAFSYGIRSMRPDLIVTDELMGGADLAAVRAAALSGVAVIASIHAGTMDELKKKPGMQEAMADGIFGRYAVLSCRRGPGTFEGVYDEAQRQLWDGAVCLPQSS
ncbi:MAG: Flp pilus assembly complex ATPase component TadA [Clostridiales bacterium]|jgi:stage III sporulation protein AA|nr:Flp pilus assembly complex ATPase component TadA [Clostridiales bacterium]